MWLAQGCGVSHGPCLTVEAELPARPGPLRFCTKYDFMNITCRGYSHLIEDCEACTTQFYFPWNSIACKSSLLSLSSALLSPRLPLAMLLGSQYTEINKSQQGSCPWGACRLKRATGKKPITDTALSLLSGGGDKETGTPGEEICFST